MYFFVDNGKTECILQKKFIDENFKIIYYISGAKEEGNLIHNDLLCGEGGIISAEPAKRIRELASIAKDDDNLLELLENDDMLER